jgi:hypothetical protein
MLEPFLHLMLDGIDVAATVLFLLALWDGRQTRWFGTPCPSPVRANDDVMHFLAQARQVRLRAMLTRHGPHRNTSPPKAASVAIVRATRQQP